MTDAERERIRAARLHALGEQAGLTLGVALLIASLTVLALSERVQPQPLVVWLGLVAVQAAVRWAVWRRLRLEAPNTPAHWRRWSFISVAGAVISGAIWGAAPLVFPGGNAITLYFLAVVIAGMCAGTTAVNSYFAPAVIGYVLPATLGQAAGFARHGARADVIAVFMVGAFAAALCASSLSAHLLFGRRVAMQLRLERRERELLDAQARLRAEAEERREMQDRLHHAQKMEAIGQLAGGIAHDFNNVIQAVLGAAGLIAARTADPGLRRLAGMVTGEAARGAAVTRRLLAFARRGELRAEAFALAPVLEAMREMLAGVLGAGITIRVAAAPDLPAVLADRAQLETVLINLATNARDAMPAGGVLTLSVDADAAPPGLPHGEYLRLVVRDTGTGMDPATLARAAEPFFTTKPAGRGTGLGLATAKELAEQSGGALHIESTAGEGTAVSLFLPAGPAPAAHQPAPPPPPAGATQLVLLVDDETVLREILAEALRESGYRVVSAESGDAALALLEDGAQPDVLLTDLSMPGMDGIALIHAAQARHPGLPAVLLTGYAGEAEAPADPGRFLLLRKPVTGAELRAGVAACLAQQPG